MNEITIRRFQTEDAAEVAALIRKTLQITNAKDYSKESIYNSECILSEDGL